MVRECVGGCGGVYEVLCGCECGVMAWAFVGVRACVSCVSMRAGCDYVVRR